MNETAKEIWREKKVKLDMGEEEIMCQVGEGRDIMSILSELMSQAWSSVSISVGWAEHFVFITL